jgi:hypothetical protein
MQWEDMILEGRTEQDVAWAARKGCIRTELEHAHLMRGQLMGDGIENA